MIEPDDWRRAYCLNIYSIGSLDQLLNVLRGYACDVRAAIGDRRRLEVGLWMPASVAGCLTENDVSALRHVLAENDLSAPTANAFPFGDFHGTEVKYRVYRPTWAENSRREFTMAMAHLLASLADGPARLTISTLPLGWKSDDGAAFRVECTKQLVQCAANLEALETATGCHVRLCLEAEPGCVLTTTSAVAEFLDSVAGRSSHERKRIERYLGVCHDICHSAVMFEAQADAVRACADRGISIGKVQVSSAVEANFTGTDGLAARAALTELEELAEPRYLHQTVIRGGSLDRQPPATRSGVAPNDQEFYDDLGMALAAHRANPCGRWRTHFHVPIDLHTIGKLATTEAHIDECLKAVAEQPVAGTADGPLWEVETYAWSVSPPSIRARSLTESIAAELRNLDQRIARVRRK